jgi:hypothetical protein
VVVLPVFLPSTAWCIPHLGVSYVDHNSSRIGVITHNTNRDNFSSNSRNNSSSSNSSTVLLPHHHSRLPPGLHSNSPPATFHASTAKRWAAFLENATSPSRATHRKLWHPWSTREGPSEGSYMMDWPRQLHHRGGDSHGGRSASRYILPQ